MLLEVDIAQVQYGRQDSKDGWLVFRSEAEVLHGSKHTQEVLCVILSWYPTIPSLNNDRKYRDDTIFWGEWCSGCTQPFYLVQIIVGLSVLQIERLLLLRGKACQHLIEDVIISLTVGLMEKHVLLFHINSVEYKECFFPHSSDVTPGRQYGTFPVDTEKLWHHWSHHWREGERECVRMRLTAQWMTWKKTTRIQAESGKSIFVLTLLEKPLCIFQSDWNYHSVQFWHFQKIRAEELPPVSSEKLTAFVKICIFL